MSDAIITRGLPANVDAERAVLGAVLQDNAVMANVFLQPADFTVSDHATLWRHMATLREDGQPIDAVTLTERLITDNSYRLVSLLPTLTEGLPRSVNAEHYASIVREKSRSRQIIRTCRSIENRAQHGEGSEALLDALRDHANTLAEKSHAATFTDLEQVPGLDSLRDVPVEYLVEDFIPRESLVLVVGTRGSFKSWLQLDLAIRVSQGAAFAQKRTARTRVLVLDRENPEAVVNRRKKYLQAGNPEGLHYWGQWHQEKPASIWDRRLLDFCAKHRPLVIFDSLVRFLRGAENSAEDMARVTAAFRELVNAGGTVLVIAHRSDKPKSPEYRGSSELLAGCDIAWRMERQEDDQRVVHLKCMKNRFGEESKTTIRLEPGGFVPDIGVRRANAASVFTRGRTTANA